MAEEGKLGRNVIVEMCYEGLIFKDQQIQQLTTGQELMGYVAKVRDDGKLDIRLEIPNDSRYDLAEQKILNFLDENDGFLPLTDKSDPEEVRFRYQLKGFDQDWIATRDHQAVYSNLPPGRYEFIVTASQNNQFYAAGQRVSYAFSIRPPIFLQDWFIGLMLLLVVLAGRYFLQKQGPAPKQGWSKYCYLFSRIQYLYFSLLLIFIWCALIACVRQKKLNF